jgi:hypothetical protein
VNSEALRVAIEEVLLELLRGAAPVLADEELRLQQLPSAPKAWGPRVAQHDVVDFHNAST